MKIIDPDGNEYERGIGNPPSDGYVLSSTAAGARSWTAPGVGGASETATSIRVELSSDQVLPAASFTKVAFSTNVIRDAVLTATGNPEWNTTLNRFEPIIPAGTKRAYLVVWKTRTSTNMTIGSNYQLAVNLDGTVGDPGDWIFQKILRFPIAQTADAEAVTVVVMNPGEYLHVEAYASIGATLPADSRNNNIQISILPSTIIEQ